MDSDRIVHPKASSCMMLILLLISMLMLMLTRPFGIKYKGLKLLDVPQTNIALHFNEVVQFIEEGLENGGNLF